MSEKVVQLTADGKKRLEAELHELITDKRQEVAERIQQAKAFGDISESGEYEDAKNEQAWVEGRIRELEQTLSHAQVIASNGNGDRSIVQLGATVTLVDESGEKEIYLLVSSPEANSRENRISDQSPIGAAVMGKRKGDKVAVSAPAGTIQFTIIGIE
ncbi:MAG: transcription elongation factor GreA [Chloroflexota bacterium]|nr:transcription elongation factor GreA [Chloroflexota bacterium]